MTDYESLLELLKKYIELFNSLAGVQQDKLSAMQRYSTEQLNECMKKEQADTLLLRGYDKKRLLIQDKLQLGDKTFKEIIPSLPSEYQADFSQIFRDLGLAYEDYKTTADCAKQMIELNIHRLGNAINELKNKTNTSSAPVYTPDGSIDREGLSFKDMKI